MSRDFSVPSQRTRILMATAEEASEKGFDSVTVADIVKRAGIAPGTFYENFSGREECFLAAQEFALSVALEWVVDAAGELNDWPRRVEAGLEAFLRYVVEEPALARTCVVEALAAGPSSSDYRAEPPQALVALLKIGRDVSPYGADLPETIEEAILGGIFWAVYRCMVLEDAETIEDLLPELVEFTLTPYLGAEATRLLVAQGRAEVGVDGG